MRQEKQLLLDEINEKIQNSKGLIVAKYQGMNSGRTRAFRDIVAKAEGEFEVVRKKVFLKALEKNNLTLGVTDYEGHIGVIFIKGDAPNLSKVTVKYGEDNDKAIQVLGGNVDGSALSAEDIVELSQLPSLDVLRASFLGLLEAPMSQVVTTMDALLTSVLYCVEEKSTKEEQ